MSRVLLIDTNISSYPIYNYLCSTEHEVFVAGGNASDFLAQCAENYIKVDYSNIDSMRSLVRKLSIDYLVPGCNDVAYKVCADLNDNDSFPGIDSAKNNKILNDKEEFRKFSAQHSLSIPKTYSPSELSKDALPVIVKPVDSFSGKGITIIDSMDKLDSAIEKALKNSKRGSYVIEEFIDGQLYSHSAFISTGKIVADLIVEESCTANKFAVDTSRVLPSTLHEKSLHEKSLHAIRCEVERIADKLKLKDGLFHTQFILNESNFWIIEPTRRCPGDLYSRLIELSTGGNYSENYARPFLGLEYKFSNDFKVGSFIIRHTITSNNGGNFWTMNLENPIKIREFAALTSSGSYVEPAPKGRVGIAFFQTDTQQELDEAYQKIISRKLYECIKNTSGGKE